MRLSLVGSILAASTILASSGSVFAADISAAAPISWDGFYLGAHLGYADGEFTNYDKSSSHCWYCEANYGSDTNGIIGGGTVGYNFTAGQILLGVEGELGISKISGSATDTTYYDPYLPKTSVDMNYYGTVAGRLGYIVGDFLLYGKAGWGFMNADMNWKDPGYDAHASGSEFLNTWVYGGGVEYAYSPSVSVKLEYLRFQLDQTETMNIQDDEYPGYKQKIGIDGVNTFKVGINYHF